MSGADVDTIGSGRPRTIPPFFRPSPRRPRLERLGDQAAGAEATAEERANLFIPDAFRAAVRAILRPGDTLVVTPDTLQAGGTGRQLTVMTGER